MTSHLDMVAYIEQSCGGLVSEMSYCMWPMVLCVSCDLIVVCSENTVGGEEENGNHRLYSSDIL